MKIIDVSAGNRATWWNKRHPDCLFVDIRLSVKPDVVADSRALPVRDAQFDLAVFDPPHVNVGAHSHMARDYGCHTTAEIRGLVRLTGRELARVLRPAGLVAFKWNDHDQDLVHALALMPEFEPLFGHIVTDRVKRKSRTFWVLLRKQ